MEGDEETEWFAALRESEAAFLTLLLSQSEQIRRKNLKSFTIASGEVSDPFPHPFPISPPLGIVHSPCLLLVWVSPRSD